MRTALWPALVFCATSCLVSLHLGQDKNYDLMNYHVYNAWAVMTGRWSQDLFAAGAHTFFSPFLDVPYYIVARELFPTHGAYVVALAGIPYGILLTFIYLIARTIANSLELGRWDRAAFVAASLLLAGTGAATRSAIGTTLNDITIAALVLAAFHQILLAAADADREPSLRRVAVIGMLLGLAMGLKLTAAIYVPSMAVVVFAVARGWRSRLLNVATYGGCAFAVFVAVYGPWGWMLHGLTGNPFFPLFNGVFQSDWMTGINVRDDRFLPGSGLQWLFYPFYWTTLQSQAMGLPFRDVRLAMAYVALAGYGAAALARKDLRARLFLPTYRPIHVLALFIVCSYVVWMHQFSILRYLVATECLAGIFIVTAVMSTMRKLADRAAWLPALCTISSAVLIAAYTIGPQWGRVPVGTDLFAVQAPALDHGALVIFADTPMSFLAPGLASTSRGLRFMSVPRGFPTEGQLGADGFRHELGRRMKAKVAEHARSLYVLYLTPNAPPESDMAAFGIEMDMTSCLPGRSSLGPEFLACRGTYRQKAV